MLNREDVCTRSRGEPWAAGGLGSCASHAYPGPVGEQNMVPEAKPHDLLRAVSFCAPTPPPSMVSSNVASIIWGMRQEKSESMHVQQTGMVPEERNFFIPFLYRSL